MITVVEPAIAARLTTWERAHAMLGYSGDGAILDILIDQATRAVVDYCRRPFALETVREDFFHPAADAVLLGRDPVVEFLVVKSGEEIVPPTHCRHDAETGLLRRVDVDGRCLPWPSSALSVTYRAGYVMPGGLDATLPDPIERATIRLVGAFLSVQGRDPLIKSETVEGVGSTSWYVPGASTVLADPEAEQLLRPYRRLF